MAYIPGAGLKKPLNMFETPIYPDIKKGPDRFLWTKKNWKVDTGRTMAEIEHIPQLQEAAVLVQSYDYGSQHLYGKRPTYDVVVNKEFRPPPVERDDILPLSRIPRPLIVPRINPGGAHPSGSSVFSEQNMFIPGVEKYLTDRVKAGEIRPTFFAPIDMPIDNSVLPDLETKIPITASAGFSFPSLRVDTSAMENLDPRYKRLEVEKVASVTPIQISAPDGRENFSLEYKRPQVSASAGQNTQLPQGVTPVDFELEYNRPQISATSGQSTRFQKGITPVDYDLDYTKPQISATSGINTKTPQGLTVIDYDFETKLEGSQPVCANPNMIPVYDPNAGYQSDLVSKLDNKKHSYSYQVPENTKFHTNNVTENTKTFRRKARALNQNRYLSTQSAIPRSGITVPNIVLRKK